MFLEFLISLRLIRHLLLFEILLRFLDSSEGKKYVDCDVNEMIQEHI